MNNNFKQIPRKTKSTENEAGNIINSKRGQFSVGVLRENNDADNVPDRKNIS